MRAEHDRIVLSRAMGERIRIRETKRGRALEIDGTFASWWSREGKATGSVWDALAAPLLALPASRRRRVLILGLGGGVAVGQDWVLGFAASCGNDVLFERVSAPVPEPSAALVFAAGLLLAARRPLRRD